MDHAEHDGDIIYAKNLIFVKIKKMGLPLKIEKIDFFLSFDNMYRLFFIAPTFQKFAKNLVVNLFPSPSDSFERPNHGIFLKTKYWKSFEIRFLAQNTENVVLG
jgi:hypothetical protein